MAEPVKYQFSDKEIAILRDAWEAASEIETPKVTLSGDMEEMQAEALGNNRVKAAEIKDKIEKIFEFFNLDI